MQQINLYLQEFRPKRELLTALHIALSLFVLLVLLVLASFYSHFQYTQLQKQLIGVQQSQELLQSQMLKIVAEKPAQVSGAELDVKIQQLQKELQRRQKIAAMISYQNLGNDKGFSIQLSALAQASLDTISLDAFSLQNGGSYAELKGKARSADQIPLYVQKLRADPGFAKVGFGVMTVIRDEKNAGILQFSLAKAVDEKTKKINSAGDLHVRAP